MPAAAFLGLTLPVIVALYFLRIRRPTRIVPALNLWPDQIRDRQANVPWQRIRFSWLLLLQLLAAAVLVAAAAQPARSTDLPAKRVSDIGREALCELADRYWSKNWRGRR